MTADFTTLFVNVDDCWKTFEKMYAKHLIEDGTRKRSRQGNLSTSEIMTILIAFQTSGYTRLPKKPSLKIEDIRYQPRELLCLTA